jgi:hypothetical protein
MISQFDLSTFLRKVAMKKPFSPASYHPNNRYPNFMEENETRSSEGAPRLAPRRFLVSWEPLTFPTEYLEIFERRET